MSTLGLALWQHHRGLADVPGHRRSKVIPAIQPPRHAVVFVHGFTGDALQTWRNFDQLLPQAGQFGKADLFFFGYDGFKSNTLAAASFLFGLLDELGKNPERLLAPVVLQQDQGKRAKGYDRIVVAAHSLGAVVTRWALVQAHERQCGWCSKLRFILFAPAHSGSELHQLASQALGAFSWAKALLAGATAGFPLIRELRPDSPVIRTLEERTCRALEAGAKYLAPSHVVIAEREIVVSNVPFGQDPPPLALPDTDHENVCKPTSLSDRQVKLLEDLL